MRPGQAGAALVLCAHGAADVRGRRTVSDLAAAVRHLRRDLHVELAFVDVQPPAVGDVVDRLARQRPLVVVPLLLCGGYHVRVDVARAVAPWPAAASAGPLGPHPALTDLMRQRVVEAGGRPGDHVVVAAAGSSRPEATADAQQVALDLGRTWPGRVTVGFGSAASPSATEAVETARRDGAGRVIIASYLLGHGFFHTKLTRAGADAVTEPLGAHPAVVQVVLARYAESVAALQAD